MRHKHQNRANSYAYAMKWRDELIREYDEGIRISRNLIQLFLQLYC